MEIIRKLWSGEFRLVTAFWIFFVLGPFIGILLALVVMTPFYLIFHIRPVGYALGFLTGVSYMFIAAVGVWRSANAYPYAGLWPALAKICVLLQAANAVWDLTHGGAHTIMGHFAATLT